MIGLHLKSQELEKMREIGGEEDRQEVGTFFLLLIDSGVFFPCQGSISSHLFSEISLSFQDGFFRLLFASPWDSSILFGVMVLERERAERKLCASSVESVQKSDDRFQE